MDERDQERESIIARTEGTGRLRAGVDAARLGVDRARLVVEDATWFVRERVAWPAEDRVEGLGPRGRIGVFGGGAVAVGAVVAALVIAGSGGSGSDAGTTEAFAIRQHPAATTSVAPTPTGEATKKTAKPSGPTLHGAPPDFAPAKDVKAGVGGGKAVEKEQSTSTGSEGPAERGTATSAGDAPAATAKIGATPAASATAEQQADSLATGSSAGISESGSGTDSGKSSELTGPPAPKAAKQTARRFAEAFVVYEVGGVDTQVRKAFGQTSTKQLSRSLLRRPPRQPANVKVPQAKVVNVVAGPSEGTVYTVSVSLLRVGVTNELRLELEQGTGNKWQVTNVLG
jgi:hypothetical protein